MSTERTPGDVIQYQAHDISGPALIVGMWGREVLLLVGGVLKRTSLVKARVQPLLIKAP